MELKTFNIGVGSAVYVCLRGVSQTAEEKLKKFMSSLGNKNIVYGIFKDYDQEQNRCVRLGGDAEAKLYERYGQQFADLLDCYIDEQKCDNQVIMLGCSVGSTILQWAYEYMKHKNCVIELVCCAPKFCVTQRPECYLFWNEDDDKIPFEPHFHTSKAQLVKPKCFTYLTGGHDFPTRLLEFLFMRMTTYIAVDIETTGASYKKHKILSVGFVVGDGVELLERKRFNISANWKSVEEGGDFEARCINEFWSKMDEKTKEDCKRDALEDSVAWKAIESWLNEMEHKYRDIAFLTDNASFDIARIDYCLDKYCDRSPMRFTTTGKYRAIYSADDMYSMLSSEQRAICDKQIAEIVVHDHNPVNDAWYVYMQYVMAMKYRLP